MFRRLLLVLVAGAGALAWACSGTAVTGPAKGQGMLAMRLTDAPLPLDSVSRVDIFIERVDARRVHADSAQADSDVDGNHEPSHMSISDSTMWVSIATPNRTFNLLDLQNGVTALLGATPIDTGHFTAVRLIIDPTRSSVTLANGKVLTDTSTPPVEFESASRHGFLVEMGDTVDVRQDTTTTITLDFRLGQSIALRGHSISDGLFLRPFVTGKGDHEFHDGHGGGGGH